MQQETLERIRDGDLDAYEAVVRQYQGILLGYAAHRLPDINAWAFHEHVSARGSNGETLWEEKPQVA